MKTKKILSKILSLTFVLALLVCGSNLILPVFAEDDGETENKIYCIKDFWTVNRNRNWFDGGTDSLIANGGSVTYDENARYMTLDFLGNSLQNNMWGVDNSQIPTEDRDWSKAKYVVVEFKNLTENPAHFSLIISSGTNNNDAYLGTNVTCYFRSNDGTVTSSKGDGENGVIVPASFDGYVAIPVTGYGVNWGKVIRLSLRFYRNKPCHVRIGRLGYAISDAFITDAPFEVVDPTVYGIPQVPAFQKAPLRPSTEPAESQENRYE